jgi:sarcosine oxidase
MTVERAFDVTVVGAGIMGAAAAAELASRGRSVGLLDQFEPGHNRGSSHGQARIFRLAYDIAEYVRLAKDTLPLWLELQAEAGRELFRPGGAFDVGPPDRLTEIEWALRSCDVTVHRLDGKAFHDMAPGIVLSEGWDALYQPEGGTLWAARCLEAFLVRARRLGAHIVANEPVVRIRTDCSAPVVETATRVFTSTAVVLTPGGWSDKLLQPLDITLPIRVTREHVAYFPSSIAGSFRPFIWHPAEGAEVYGLSNLADETVKIGYHIAGHEVKAGADTTPNDEEVARVAGFARDHMLEVGPQPVLAETCLYASTPDDDFVVDRVGPITVGAGFGGHGFKFAPTIGRILADLVDGRPAGGRFSLSRFAPTGVHAG